MNLTETFKSAVRADGIHLTPEQLTTALHVQQGVATATDIAGDVLAQMAPTDDTPLHATWGELAMVGFERLGAKVGVRLPVKLA